MNTCQACEVKITFELKLHLGECEDLIWSLKYHLQQKLVIVVRQLAGENNKIICREAAQLRKSEI